MAGIASSAFYKNDEFSLVLGGPLYQLLARAHLLAPPIRFLNRRLIASIIITWLPLALLTLLEGTFYKGVEVSFLTDLGNTRFLIALPILIAAELLVHRRIRPIVEQFHDRGLIAPEDDAKFKTLIDRAMNLRNSVAAEVILALLSYTGGHWLWQNYGSLQSGTWYVLPGDPATLSWAGYWYIFVSLPILRFILLRWYFRLFIWYLFLWRVAHLRLRLDPLHPDRAGGLGFLNTSIAGFTPVLIAQSCFLSAQVGNEIMYRGAKLAQFQIIIVVAIIFLILTVLVPLAFFAFQLINAKLNFAREYGTFASRYAEEFQKKWLSTVNSPKESLLGSADIQSLSDLSNSYEVVSTTRIFPFDKTAVIKLVVALLLPLLPLVLTVFSFKDVVERLIKLLI